MHAITEKCNEKHILDSVQIAYKKELHGKMNCMEIHEIKQIAPPRTQALPTHDVGQRAGAPVWRAGKIGERSALRREHASHLSLVAPPRTRNCLLRQIALLLQNRAHSQKCPNP